MPSRFFMQKVKNPRKHHRPTLGEVAESVAGAMVVEEVIEPLGYAIARDEAGNPIYLVAVIMGPENIAGVSKAFDQMKPKLAKVPEMAAVDRDDEVV